mmetsp:Transcript_45141/g.52211  ORF Transcript_45141/g.52211 Transcript_45141/m.52211 type:complete len:103 (-) Transcript_45141:167-475(-)
MGAGLVRNRHWWYRSLYDDYYGRETRFAFGLAGIIWIPHYLWGIHLNREIEVNYSHKNYQHEYGPRRNRLTHSMVFEEFEIAVERWQDLEAEYKEKGGKMFA